MAEDVQFVCGVCHKDYKGDTENVMTECRLCGRIHCEKCVDEFGQCVECVEKQSSKDWRKARAADCRHLWQAPVFLLDLYLDLVLKINDHTFSIFNGLLPKPNSCGYNQLWSIYPLCNILILFMPDFDRRSDCGQTGVWATARQALTPNVIESPTQALFSHLECTPLLPFFCWGRYGWSSYMSSSL